MASLVTVNFTCQRCHQPVHLNQGFSHLSELTLAELACKYVIIQCKDLVLKA